MPAAGISPDPEPVNATLTKVWSRIITTNEARGSLSAPIELDSDKDGVQDIVVTSSDGKLFILNGRSGLNFQFVDLGVRLTAPTRLDLGFFRSPLIIVGGADRRGGFVKALNAAANTVWTTDYTNISDAIVSAPVLGGDITGDKIPEIICYDAAGNVYCFSGSSGALLWKFTSIDGAFSTAIGLGRVNADELPDIIVGTTNGSVIALDGLCGKALWDMRIGARPYGKPVVRMSTHKETYVHAAETAGSIIALSSYGAPRWYIAGLMPSTDFAFDSYVGGDSVQLLCACMGQGIRMVEVPSGRVVWTYPNQKSYFAPLHLMNINADPYKEILAIDSAGNMAIISPIDGRLLIPAPFALGQPVINDFLCKDLDRDMGTTEVVVVTEMRMIYWFTAAFHSRGSI